MSNAKPVGTKSQGGPRTQRGKHVSAQNARTHGATGRPEAQSIGYWIAVLRGLDTISVSDLIPGGRTPRPVHRLAEAEARLAKAEEALVRFENREWASFPEAKRAQEDVEFYTGILQRPGGARLYDLVGKPLRDAQRRFDREMRLGGRRHQLLRRYLRTAERARNAAFREYLAWRRGATF